MQMTTTREFRKHRVLGEIYAVEFLDVEGAREPVAVTRCTRPEQLTRGALPVLPLLADSLLAFYQNNTSEFELWEPQMVDEEKLAAIIAAEQLCQETEADWKRADMSAKALKKLHEKACDDLRRMVREANTPAQAPLLALADSPNLEDTTDDDRDDGTDDRRDDGSEQHPH